MADSIADGLRRINDIMPSYIRKVLSRLWTKETILMHWIAIHFLPPASNCDEVVGLWFLRKLADQPCGIVKD